MIAKSNISFLSFCKQGHFCLYFFYQLHLLPYFLGLMSYKGVHLARLPLFLLHYICLTGVL